MRKGALVAASWVAAAAVLLGGLWGAQPAQAAACAPSQSSAGTDVVLTFSSVGTCDWTVPGWVTSVRVLVVGGGGGGGVNYRGGGGAGGMQEQSSYSVTPNAAVSVTVGAGGLGAYYDSRYVAWWGGDPGGNQYATTVSATNGGASSFGSFNSLGGGFGSGCYSGSLPAGNGGSGGGSTGCAAGSGTTGQGSNGSTSGGGGGAGGTGTTEGGPGSSSDITGVSVTYAGGGGRQGSNGGSGGGGAGSNVVSGFAQAGTDGKGGGGGGGGYFPDGGRLADFSNDTSIGGKGGSGVVIVRYEGRTAQTITVATDKNPIIEEQTATLSASGYSGTGVITYAVASGSDVCSVNGATLATIKPGTCTVTASITYDATYGPATSTPLTITVTARLSQSLTIAADPNPVFARKVATLRPVGQSGTGTMTYSVQSGSEFCSITDDKLTGLTPGSCTVVGTIARDSTYASATSPPYTVEVRAGTPERPLMVDASPGDRQVTVIWDAPTYDGGSAIREYHVYAWPSGKRECTVKATGSSRYTCIVTGLRNGTSYEFWVQASSLVGLSPISERVKAKPAGKPTAPRNVTATASDGVLRLTWDPPEDDGGSPLIQYLVERRLPGGTWEARGYVDASKQTSAVMSSLVNSKDYEFRVSVNNASGYSPPSDPVTASVTVPRSFEAKLPDQAPPQSFLSLGRLEKGSTYVKVASRTQRTCQVAEQYTNTIAFLQAGKCKLILFRDTASVDGASVDEYELEVVPGAERTGGVQPMEIWRFTFRPDSTGLDKASDARLRDFSAEWGWARNLPRPAYGAAYTFCPPSTINASGAFADRKDLASRRCNAMSWLAGVAVRNTVDNDGRIAAKPKLGSANDDEIFEVGMLPKFWPPSAPRNLKVEADAYDAMISWDPPEYDGGADKIGYAVYVRPEGENKWIQVSSEGLKARVAATMWGDIPVERDIDVMVKASSFGGGQGGVAQTTFRLSYRKPQTANIPAQVPVGSWMEVFEDRGRPATVATVPSEYSSACSVYQYRYLAFVGQGKCLVITYQLNGKGGSTPRRGEVVEVTAGGARGAGLTSMALEEITFSGKSSQPDARGMKVIDGLKDKEVIGYHLYSPIPGPMPAGLAKERFDKVWQLLQVKSNTSMTWSTLKSSGLPEGDGNTIYVAVVRAKGGSSN